MLDLSTAIREHLQSRGGRHAQLLVRIAARDRETGAIQSTGFWTGKDHQDFTAEGVTQTYFGAGTLLDLDHLVVEKGLNVRTQRLVFSKVAPEVQLALRGYETREADTRIYIAYFNPLTREMIDAPVRRFKGKTVGLKIKRAKRAPGKKTAGPATAELSVLSNAVELTKTLAVKKSEAALQGRAPGDGFRRYTDISGTVEVAWGELRATALESTSAASATPAPVRETTDR